MSRPSEIVVVGAGAAGLAAAARLCRHARVTIVEARDRFGGRVHTVTDPVLGIPLEYGAEFVHGRPKRTLRLAKAAGTRIRQVPDRHARRVGARLVEAASAFAEGEELLGLGGRDDEPFAAVLRRAQRERRCSAEAIAMATEFVRGFYLADPRTASSAALARFTRALDEIEGDVTGRVDGGYARVLEPLVRSVRAAGADVWLSTVVEEIRWRPGHVELRARGAAGSRLPPLHARRAIVTLPVSMLRGDVVRFRPALSAKHAAARSIPMGAIVKVVLRFRRALWDEGRRGLSFLHVPRAPFPVFWTLAPVRAPVLVGWAGGRDAERLSGKGEQDVLRAALRSAALGLGRAARELEAALDGASVIDWSREPYAGGGYAVFPVGTREAAAELARSVAATLFFAGEATAGGHAGTVDGAIASGERAARELLGE